MSRKSKQPSKTELRRHLRDCLFDPRKPGPMQVIADTGNEEYYENRAKECVSQFAETSHEKSDNIRMAIGLLLLSLAKRNGKYPQNQ